MREPIRISRITTLSISVVLAGLLVLAQTMSGTGQETTKTLSGGTRIGFIDIDKILDKATFVQKMMDDMQKTAAVRSESIDKKMAEYQRLNDEIKQKSAILSDTEATNMRNKARALRNAIQDEEDDLNRLLSKNEKEMMAPAMKKILKTVQEVAIEEKFDIVLRGEIVIWGNDLVNLSNRVIARLNSETIPKKSSATPKPVGKTPNI